MIDGPTPKDGLVPALPPTPAANDARWSNIIPTSYNFTGIGARTLFAWIKDVAGNVSNSKSANTVISICPAISAPVCNEGEEMVQDNGVDANGCPLPPVCKPIVINTKCPQSTVIDGRTYTLSPCSIDMSMVDGQGNQTFSTTIVPSDVNLGYGYGVMGYGVGFPNYGIIGAGSGGASGNTKLEFTLNDDYFSSDNLNPKTYSGYLPIYISHSSATGSYLYLNVNLTVKPQ